MRHHDFGDGRYVIRLDPGDEVIASLTLFAQEAGIEAGHATGFGAVDRIVLGFLDPEAGEYVRRTFEEPMEVAQLTASISMEGDRPVVHGHAVVAPRELLCYGGHVHEARVGVVLEIYVHALPGRLDRFAVPDQPYLRLLLPGEEPPSEEASGR